MIKKLVTIKDVAIASGVSIGTVDRIVHNRGRVSPETEKTVRQKIAELGFRPNIHASMLSVKKEFRIAVIIPFFQSGDFWSLINLGITKALEEYEALRIDLIPLYYNQFDEASFKQACEKCKEISPDGLLMAPIHKDLSWELVNTLNKKGTSTIFIDTMIPDCDYLAFYGINMFDSAYIAADLLFKRDPGIRRIVSFNIDRGNYPKNEAFEKRRNGLLQYISDFNLGCELVECPMSPSDFMGNINTFDGFFRANPDIRNIITFNSRAHLISDWMEIRGYRQFDLTGYDMIPSNMEGVRKGTITTLIAERTDLESYSALKSLIEHLAFGRIPEKRDNFFPIDILTKYNVDYYLG